MQKKIRQQLEGLSESEYQKFSSSLIPGISNMLGIRLPKLRELAKEIAKSDWKQAIAEEDYYFEEKMLHGMVLGYVKADFDTLQPYITEFIPLVDNWSVCDSVFMGMNIFQKDRERTWKYILPYLQSDKEFEVRVAVIIMMQHLLKCDSKDRKKIRLRKVCMDNLFDEQEEKGLYFDCVFDAIDKVNTEPYYVSMAVAWLVAESFCVFPYHTYQYLCNHHLDDQTYKRAIRKIIESRIPTEDVKEHLKIRSVGDM